MHHTIDRATEVLLYASYPWQWTQRCYSMLHTPDSGKRGATVCIIPLAVATEALLYASYPWQRQQRGYCMHHALGSGDRGATV